MSEAQSIEDKATAGTEDESLQSSGESSTSEEKPLVVERKISRNKHFAEQRIGEQRDKFKAESNVLGDENAQMTVQLANLQAENEKLKQAQNQTMPTMAQFDNDAEQFQVALNQYYQGQNTALVNKQLNEFVSNQAASNQNNQSDAAINNHYDRAQKAGRADYNEAEKKAVDIIGSELAQGIIENTANSDEILYMLGDDSARARALASMTPMQATVEIGRLSAQAGSFKKETRPDPEEGVQGGKPPSATTAALQKRYDAALEKAQNGGSLEELKEAKKALREAGAL